MILNSRNFRRNLRSLFIHYGAKNLIPETRPMPRRSPPKPRNHLYCSRKSRSDSWCGSIRFACFHCSQPHSSKQRKARFVYFFHSRCQNKHYYEALYRPARLVKNRPATIVIPDTNAALSIGFWDVLITQNPHDLLILESTKRP
jgi:hypothetical protein